MRGHVDHEATAAAHFLNKRSRILLNGREILCGEDYLIRKVQAFIRDCHCCTVCGEHLPFSTAELDHHPVSRGSNGVDRDDRLSNVRTICRPCHRRKHP